jgi:hypothetical protein
MTTVLDQLQNISRDLDKAITDPSDKRTLSGVSI